MKRAAMIALLVITTACVHRPKPKDVKPIEFEDPCKTADPYLWPECPAASWTIKT